MYEGSFFWQNLSDTCKIEPIMSMIQENACKTNNRN